MTRQVLRAVVVSTVLALTAGIGFLVPAAAAYDTRPLFSWVPNGRVYAMAEASGVVYLGGTFTSLRNPATGERVDRERLAAISASTGELIASWDPGANDTVRALAVSADGTIYAGGDFTTAAGVSATRAAAITPVGAAVSGWDASANNTVRSIVVTNEAVFVAGNFSRIDGVRRIGVARLDPSDGDLATGWDARARRGRVRALALSPNGTDLIVGGSFKSLSGVTRMFAGTVALDSGAVRAWAPSAICDTCQVLGLTTADGTVFAAVGGRGGGRAAAWSLATAQQRWVSRGDGDVQSVAVHGGVAYFGGHFGPRFLNQERHQLVALDANTGALLDFVLPFTGNDHPGIWAIIADSAVLRIAGGFRLSNSPAARYAVFPAL